MINTAFNDLWEVVKKFGPTTKIAFEIRELEKNGLEIFNLKNLIRGKEGLYQVFDNGAIAKIILYICDIRHEYVLENKYTKFHLFNCETIDRMEKEGRSHRFVISTRTDGVFKIYSIKDNKERLRLDVKLKICKNCLRLYNDYYSKNVTVEDFDKSHLDLFLKCESFVEIMANNYTHDYDVILNFYPDDWKKISRKIKNKKKYTCENCGWHGTGENKRYINSHHLDGKKYNSNLNNIKVLCVVCHAKQPGHEHIKKTNDYYMCKQIQNSLSLF